MRRCDPKAHGSKGKDTAYEACDSFCNLQNARSHCRWCKCKACNFCSIGRNSSSGSSGIRWHASSRYCSAMLHDFTHLFRRMWSATAYGRMHTNTPACWERQRDHPRRNHPARLFFADAYNGTFCRTNWYEGHPGLLGMEGALPRFSQPAPALLGTDDGIHDYCVAQLTTAERARPRHRKGAPGHVANSCMAANINILNMVGHRVPWNLCRAYTAGSCRTGRA